MANLGDPKYHAANFGRLPLSHLARTLDFVERRTQVDTNLASLTTARLASVVVSAVAGRNARQVKASDFLPFDPMQTDKDEQRSALSEEGRKTLKKLIKTKQLPVMLFGLVMDDLRG
jgi:hypothetical protein